MKKLWPYVTMLAAAAILAACSSAGDYTGTDRGLDWNIETTLGASVNGRSTTYKHATEKPLGTLTITPQGMDMTGPGVEIYARKLFCDTAPNADECNGLLATNRGMP